MSQLVHRAAGMPRSQDDYEAACTFTIDDALDRCGIAGRFHWFLLLYTGLSWACDAMEVMILSYLGPSARCEWGLSATQESLLTSMVFMGMTLGAPVWGMLSDMYGRKLSFFGATLCTTVFGFATAASPNYSAMLAFRTLVGFGIPGAVVAFNLLLEFTPTRMRGMFAVGIEGFWTLGTIAQAGMAYGLLNQHGWRLLVAASTIPYVILLVLVPFLPESPRYLLVKGETEKAQQVLTKVVRVCKADMPEGRLQPLLAGTAYKDSAADAAPEGPKGKWLLGKVSSSVSSVWSALQQMFSRKLAMTTTILIFIWMVAAFVYYGLVTLVAQVDFVETGKKECKSGRLYVPNEDLTGILITSSAEVPGLIFSLVIVYYLGRKVAFAIPLALIAVVLVPMMAGIKGPGMIVCMYLSRFFIYSSFNILWAMTPEYYPTSIRNFGLGVNNAFSRIGGLLSPFAAVNARQTAWIYAPELIFAVLALVAAGSVLLLPPDKKDKALDDCLDDVKDVPEIQRRASSLIGSITHSSTITGGGGSWSAAVPGFDAAGQQQRPQQGLSAGTGSLGSGDESGQVLLPSHSK